jgi:hypothetical protein
MGGVYSTYGRRRGVYGVLWGNMRQRGHLEDPGIVGRIILRWIFRKWDVMCIDWIDLAQDMDRWRALENAVMILWFPQYARNFRTGRE